MNTDISILIAFGAGILSFLSPCVLPLIPSYLTLLLGDYADREERSSTILPALIFIGGFSIVFIILGLSASFLGQFLLRNLLLLRKVSGVVVIILGLNLAGIIRINLLYREKGFELPENLNKHLRALLMGFALSLAWTPCIGPILSSILIYAGTSSTILQGGILLAFYSLGFALPFFLAALFLNWLLPRFKKITPYLPLVQKITGFLLIILGILIYTDLIQLFSQLQ